MSVFTPNVSMTPALRRLSDEAGAGEDALHGPSRMVLAHGHEKGAPQPVVAEEVEEARHPGAHALEGVHVDVEPYDVVGVFRAL